MNEKKDAKKEKKRVNMRYPSGNMANLLDGDAMWALVLHTTQRPQERERRRRRRRKKEEEEERCERKGGGRGLRALFTTSSELEHSRSESL